MDCKRMKETILTDYVDGKLKDDALREVESHLGSCPECRALAEEARSDSLLLRAAPRHEAPPRVWDSIRAAMGAVPEKKRLAWGIWERLRALLSHPRPVFVMATAVALLLFALVAVRLMPGSGYLENGTEEYDIFSVSSINGGDDETGFGTTAEYYFL